MKSLRDSLVIGHWDAAAGYRPPQTSCYAEHYIVCIFFDLIGFKANNLVPPAV
jgi:hypothetical protein